MPVSRETLAAVAQAHALPARDAARMEALLAALANEPAPPTTVTDPDDAAERHVADSLAGLAVSALRQAGRIADLGAGAGFPGLPLAIALPHASVDLVESTGRKCEVIDRLATAADISNASSIAARAEELGASDAAGGYDVVTARALASLPVLVEYAAPLLRIGGALVAWKGAPKDDELQAGASAAAQLGMEPAAPVAVRPFRDARARSLHVFVKGGETPSRFPRRPGMAVKRPLA